MTLRSSARTRCGVDSTSASARRTCTSATPSSAPMATSWSGERPRRSRPDSSIARAITRSAVPRSSSPVMRRMVARLRQAPEAERLVGEYLGSAANRSFTSCSGSGSEYGGRHRLRGRQRPMRMSALDWRAGKRGREQPGRARPADVGDRLEPLGERQVHEAVAAQHQVGRRQRVARSGRRRGTRGPARRAPPRPPRPRPAPRRGRCSARTGSRAWPSSCRRRRVRRGSCARRSTSATAAAPRAAAQSSRGRSRRRTPTHRPRSARRGSAPNTSSGARRDTAETIEDRLRAIDRGPEQAPDQTSRAARRADQASRTRRGA